MLRRHTTMKFDRLMMLRHIALAACLATTGCGGGDASGAPQTDTGSKVEPAGPDPVVPTPTPTPAANSTPKKNIGINLWFPSYWSGERNFANLVSGSTWLDRTKPGWPEYASENVDANGTITTLDGSAAINLTPPADVKLGKDTRIRCTYEGEGTLFYDGFYPHPQDNIQNGIEFTWIAGKNVYLLLDQSNPSNPLRNLDCRETTMPRQEFYAPEFLDSLAPYSTVRFLDWQPTNSNIAVSWATRTLPSNVSQARGAGVAIENMVDLANKVEADPWFTIPWNADETYVRNFAILVRDRLANGRKVYVELANEPWNGAFPVFHQIQNEAVDANMSTDKFQGLLFRYAQKSTWAFKIWTQVFAATPQRLVRVVNIQSGSFWGAEQVLGFENTADYVDAVATAPYFGHSLLNDGETNLDILFQALATDAKKVLADAVKVKEVADRYKLRFIAYEGGQHVSGNAESVTPLNRDPRMYEIYKSYLTDWTARFDDNMTLYAATGPAGNMAWGLREYSGQPLSETPKRRAVLDYIAGK